MITSRKITDTIRNKPQVEIVSFLAQCKAQAPDGLIDLSIGNPDVPPCKEAIDELVLRSQDPKMHGYGNFNGIPELKDSICEYYDTAYKTKVSHEEIVIVRGIRSAIFAVAGVFAAAGDSILFPSVSYPSYFLAADFCGASTQLIPVSSKNGYIPDLESVPEEILRKSKLLYLNFPNNPTGAIIEKRQLEKIVEVARKYSILICYDNAYNEIVFEGAKPISFMEIEGAREVGVELFSFSKLTSLAGWRISFIAGGKHLIEKIYEYLSLTDTAPYNGFQYAAAVALRQNTLSGKGKELAAHYEKRKKALEMVCDDIGLEYFTSKGGFYLWVRSPFDDGRKFTHYLLEKIGLLVVPGDYYGSDGDAYVRFSLTTDENEFAQVLKRMKTLSFKTNTVKE